ncbi:MAG: N-(5'-phosphoribosyl)anthranilate isomerase [Fimbriimonadaceae bacterium]|nr:N-(5'-phosphoribosyl)anthranilate isomerase [Fimbriimonadaceae bacterium]
MVTRIKICGLTRPEDVAVAAEEGASAIGIVLDPISKRCVADAGLLVELLAAVPPYVTRVAVFGTLVEIPPLCRFDAVQFVDPGSGQSLDLKRIRAIRIAAGDVPPQTWPHADAVLLDARVEGTMGGTGHTVDESTAQLYLAASPVPVILAGGLTPDNVAAKVLDLQPYAVDVSSGVEASPGTKDHDKIRKFCEAVREADQARRKKTRGC